MIIRANSLFIPLKDESVNCIITSPPYWSLRKYDIPDLIWDEEWKSDPNCIDCTHLTVGPDGYCAKCGGHIEHDWGDELKNPKFDKRNPGEKKNQGAIVGSSINSENWAMGKLGQFCLHCSAWRGQLGLEPTVDLYLKHLLQIMDECKRVLRDDGTCWINIGDSYGGSGSPGGDFRNKYRGDDYLRPYNRNGVPPKSMCLIPERFAIEMVNRGWLLRNKLIWHKPNCMPSSAKDRFTVDFEPVFFFVKSNDIQYWTNEKTGKLVSKQPLGTKGIESEDWEWREVSGKRKKVSFWSGHDYWFEQQYEPMNYPDRVYNPDTSNQKTAKLDNRITGGLHDGRTQYGNPKNGRNRRCVWTIPTQPYPESHFATFPEALVEPMIKAGCPQFVCKKCGKAREKILKPKFTAHDGKINSKYDPKVKDGGAGRLALLRQAARERGEEYHQELEFLGYTDCGCNAEFEGGVCLDPFAGSGTVLRVAEQLNRKAIGLDLGYQSLSVKRLQNVQKELQL